MMNVNGLITTLQKSNAEYKDDLVKFFQLYMKYAQWLQKYALSSSATDREKFLIDQYEIWFYREGQGFWIDTIENIDRNATEKFLKFVAIYEFLLSSSEGDVEKIIDHLFYIPGEFSRQFMKETVVLTWTIKNEKKDNICVVYHALSKTGVFEEIPFFNKWRIY